MFLEVKIEIEFSPQETCQSILLKNITNVPLVYQILAIKLTW